MSKLMLDNFEKKQMAKKSTDAQTLHNPNESLGEQDVEIAQRKGVFDKFKKRLNGVLDELHSCFDIDHALNDEETYPEDISNRIELTTKPQIEKKKQSHPCLKLLMGG